MILTCYLNNRPAWAELVPADAVLPRPHHGWSYTLEARK